MVEIATTISAGLDFDKEQQTITGTLRGVRRAALRSEIDMVRIGYEVQENFPNLYHQLCGKADPEVVAHIEFTL